MKRVNHLRPTSTNWYVVTGGPCSGKTTLVNALAVRGYKTTIEDARHYIDLQLADGKTVDEIRKHQVDFQLKVLNMQIDQESALDPGDIVFLDRAIPDALAYYHFLHIPEDEELIKMMAVVSYKKVFILDPLPLVDDYARHEDTAAQKRLQTLITAVYESLPFPVVHVPVLPPDERVEFVIANM